MLKEIKQRITEYLTTTSTAVTRRLRIVSSRFSSTWKRTPVNDWGRSDYDFWRRAYRCQAKGLELSGLLIKPLVNKTAAWVLGQPPQWKMENETTLEALVDWWGENHSHILKAYRESIKLADSFIVVNPDLTLEVIPPQLVTPIVDEDDFSQRIGWRVTQTHIHPDNTNTKMTITDEYTAETRVRTVEVDGRETSQQTFPNLIGRVPVIHIANNAEAGETFGRPEGEALVNVLQRYGLILEAGIEGNELQGRPTPVLSFENQQDLDAFWETYGETERITTESASGELVESTTTVLSVDLKQILTVAGATFDYKSPGSFIGEAVKLLEIMFYLILEHTELPEFIFGNAVASSKASTETQMPIFAKFIEMKRGEARGWLVELAQVVIALLSLTTPNVTEDEPKLQWEQLVSDDGKLTLEAIKWAYAEGLLDDRTALQLAPVDIEDIDGVLEAAKEEREERQGDEQFEPSQPSLIEDEINRLELEGEQDGNE